MFHVIIAGTRTFEDYDLLKTKCDYFFQRKKPTAIVCGEARGADTLGKRYASENGILVISVPADWERHGKKAGYLRNQEMARYADALIVFWDGRSKGTRNMLEIAVEKGIPYRVVRY